MAISKRNKRGMKKNDTGIYSNTRRKGNKSRDGPSSVLKYVMYASLFISIFIAYGKQYALFGSQEFEKKAGLVILAFGRSGSSFIGSWFESDPEHFLFFLEPCALTYTLKPVGTTGKACGKIVNEVLNCNFKSVHPEATKNQHITEEEFEGWGNRSAVENCKQQQVVIKEIRLGAWALNDKYSFLDKSKRNKNNEKNADKMIVLFRDPRSIIASRKLNWNEGNFQQFIHEKEDALLPPSTFKVFLQQKGADIEVKKDEATEQYKQLMEMHFRKDPPGYNPYILKGYPYKQSIKSLCLEQSDLLRTLQDVDLSQTRNVMRVTYLDILNHPLQTAEKVFSFMQMKIPPVVKKHIQNHISGQCKHKDKAFSVCRNHYGSETEEEKIELNDEKWMKVLTEDEIKYVEEMCEDAIRAQGFHLYHEILSST